MVAFELAVQDMHGLAVAARQGVDRIELCSALPLGGVTPSIAMIEAATGTPGIPPVHVLVRPRPGGFEHTPDEMALIVADVRHAVAAGAAGVVIGGVVIVEVHDGEDAAGTARADRSAAGTARADRGAPVATRADEELVGRVVEAAGGAEVTFHRAFDTLSEPEAAVETLVRLGVRRVLTSAGAASVADALPALARLVAVAGGRLEIMAGGGVRPGAVEKILRTGVPAVHASAKRTVPDSAGVSLGTAGGNGRETTDEDEVVRILGEIRARG